MTTCPTCHHPAHDKPCDISVRVYDGFMDQCAPCECGTATTRPTHDPSAVLARVKCQECGHSALDHNAMSGCVYAHGCRRSQPHILAAHIAALEARVAGDEALLYRAVSVLSGTDGRELLLRDMHARLGRKEPTNG